jgi:integrase
VKKQAFPSRQVENWPDTDRLLWLAAQKPGDPFNDERGVASEWSAATVSNCGWSYGIWLHWLDAMGQLEPSEQPCARVTRERVKAFFAAYSLGRAQLTAAGVLRDIAYVVRACSGSKGVPWFTHLAHRLVNGAKSSRPKLPRMARVSDIILLSERLMAAGLEEIGKGRRSGAPVYRDALIIGLLISRPWRRRNLADLRLGHDLFIDEFGAWVIIPPENTKKGVPFDGNLPERLRAALLTYLNQVRPILLKNSCEDEGWLWIGRRGRRMPANDITVRVTRTMRKHLGRDRSPHLFRDCAATEIAIEDPMRIGITKNVLGHSNLSSSQRFYNQASSFTAFSRHQNVIQHLRTGRPCADASSTEKIDDKGGLLRSYKMRLL